MGVGEEQSDCGNTVQLLRVKFSGILADYRRESSAKWLRIAVQCISDTLRQPSRVSFCETLCLCDFRNPPSDLAPAEIRK
jgi:hypothetical protein